MALEHSKFFFFSVMQSSNHTEKDGKVCLHYSKMPFKTESQEWTKDCVYNAAEGSSVSCTSKTSDTSVWEM